MKIPQKPPKFQELLKKESDKIAGLLANKRFMGFVKKCNSEYIPWDKLRYEKIPDEIRPEYAWMIIKILRMSQFKFLKFDKWSFRYSLLDEFQKKLHFIDKGTAGLLGSSVDSVSINEKDRKYVISSLMEEAIASSQLEGAVTTRRVAKELLRSNKKPKNYSEWMIVNGYKTMRKIVERKDEMLTPEMILELHKEITENTLKHKRYEGTFRDNNNVVVGDLSDVTTIYHQPPDYKEIPRLIEQLCTFANTDTSEFIHPIIKGIVLHFLVGYIHPFEDGNGRLARTLFYWYAITKGYWLFELMAISRIIIRSKTKYGLAYLYTEGDDNDLTYFIKYNLEKIEEAMHDMRSYIDRKQKEQSEAFDLIKTIKRINLRQAEILKEIIKNSEKSFRIDEIMNTYNVVYQTARNDLLHLTDLGYLEKIKSGKRFLFKHKQL